MHPIILFVLSLTGAGASIRSYSASASTAVVMGGSVAMAFVVCGLTAAAAKAGLRVRI